MLGRQPGLNSAMNLTLSRGWHRAFDKVSRAILRRALS